jgi:hypothetical protein
LGWTAAAPRSILKARLYRMDRLLHGADEE